MIKNQIDLPGIRTRDACVQQATRDRLGSPRVSNCAGGSAQLQPVIDVLSHIPSFSLTLPQARKFLALHLEHNRDDQDALHPIEDKHIDLLKTKKTYSNRAMGEVYNVYYHWYAWLRTASATGVVSLARERHRPRYVTYPFSPPSQSL